MVTMKLQIIFVSSKSIQASSFWCCCFGVVVSWRSCCLILSLSFWSHFPRRNWIGKMEGLKKASKWAKLARLLIEGLQVKFFWNFISNCWLWLNFNGSLKENRWAATLSRWMLAGCHDWSRSLVAVFGRRPWKVEFFLYQFHGTILGLSNSHPSKNVTTGLNETFL